MQNQNMKSNRATNSLQYEELDQKAYQRWSIKDNIKYITFLKNVIQHFESEKTRRAFKVFKVLADYLGTKTQAQCKSHHQKMIKQYSTIDTIIQKVITRAEKKNIDVNLMQSQILEESKGYQNSKYRNEKIYLDQNQESTEHDNSQNDSIVLDCCSEDDIFNVITPDVWLSQSE